MKTVDREKQLSKTGSTLSAFEVKTLSKARANEFAIKGIYKYGYRNKEDISNLPPEVLVVGSQNVVTNAAEQIVIRNGYELDGDAGNQNTYGIDSSYDFNTHTNGVRNLRKWGSNLEARYVNPNSDVVSWVSILATLLTGKVANFTNFWSVGEKKNLCLFVNGDNNVYEWSGGMASYASATANTLTVQGTAGTDTLSLYNFYTTAANAGKMFFYINGVRYQYTGAGVASVTAYNQTPTNATVFLTPTAWVSQKFTTGAAASFISQVEFRGNAVGAQAYPLNMTCGIYTDNAGVPGTLLGTATASAAAIGAGGTFTFDFYMTIGVLAATNYHVVFHSDQNTNNIEAYIGASGGVGTNVSADRGATYSASNGYLNATVTENDNTGLTFIGVTPDPTSVIITPGDAVVQVPVVGAATPNGIPQPFIMDIIATLYNQVYYGSFSNNTVYVSNLNDYSSCAFSSPRLPGEGASATLDSPPIGFKDQQEAMYIAAGRSAWWRTLFTLSDDLTNESFQINPLQTSSSQGAQSQALIGKLKNSIAFVSNEPIINAFGPVKNILGDPNFVNISDPIKYDIDAYDFSGGQVYYYNYYLYVTIPSMGIERLYNVIKKYWEAPQVVPFSRHYEVDGQLYAHSGLTNESYQCYVPSVYSDNGNPIKSVIAFPYVSQQGGSPVQLKTFNKHYLEGYIASNTTIMLTINYDFGGFTGTYTTLITGTEANIIFNKITDGSLGQNTLGSEPIGSILNLPNQPAIPKFRIINTFPSLDCFEYQVVISSDDPDMQYAILRSGPAVGPAMSLPVKQTI